MEKSTKNNKLEMRIEIGPGLGYMVHFDNHESLVAYTEAMKEINDMIDTRMALQRELASLKQELALCREVLNRNSHKKWRKNNG